MNDPDAIWKPGYDGPPPIVRAPRERADEHSPGDIDRTDPDEPRSRGRHFGVVAGAALALALGLVLVAAVVVLDPLDSSAVIERPDPSVFGGPAARRLPDDAPTLWSLDIEHDGDHWVDVVRRDLVVAAVAEPGASPLATVVALDALTGAQRWTLRLAAEPSDVTLIGAVDDVLVVEQRGVNGPTAMGVDVATGETRWSSDAAPSAGYVGLTGTPFVARLPSPADRFVSLIDAVSGRDVGTIASEPTDTGRPPGWSTDRRGTWFVIDDGEVVGYDLSAELGEPMVIGSVDDVSMPRIVVDDRLAIVDDSGSITFAGAGTRGPVTVSDDVPDLVSSLTPASGSNFVVTAPRSIAGVSVAGDTVDVTWSRNDGEVVDDHPVEGGTLLLVATRGGAGMQLVDGLTGETVEHLTMIPGALQAPVVAGDGFVALQASDLGAKLTGFDLDGAERWSIAGSMPIIVGDRIVVRATSNEVIDDNSAASSQQLRITAYGDVE